MSAGPKVSVIMPVRDGERWLAQAVESVFAQTLVEFELIIVDDGSVDGSSAIVAGLSSRDSRIRTLRHQAPRGLVAALNGALALVRAPLIARLDADDIALPDRLSQQAQRFAAQPALVLLGSWAERIDAKGGSIGQIHPETDAARLAEILCRRNPFSHSSMMMRTDLVRRLGGYRGAFLGAEDFDLWLRMSEHGEVANMAQALVHYRVHDESVGSRIAVRQCFSARLARSAAAARRSSGVDPAENLCGPPDWWAAEAPSEFYAEAALICRFLDLADRGAIAVHRTSEAPPPSTQQILEFSNAEKKLAQRAILNLLPSPHRPVTLPFHKLTGALVTSLVGRALYRPARRTAVEGPAL